MADRPITNVNAATAVSDSDKVFINQGNAVKQIEISKIRNVDATLKTSGAAADAKKTGEEIAAVSGQLEKLGLYIDADGDLCQKE